MRQWRNGAGNAPRHYAGTRSATGCALSRTRSLTAAAIAVAMMATVAVTSLLPTYSAKADDNRTDGGIFVPANITMGDSGASVNGVDTGLATFVGRDFYVGKPKEGDTAQLNDNSIEGSWASEMEGQTFIRGRYMQRAQKGFFTIGTVAFGAQYLPANDSTIIAVENKSTAFSDSVANTVQAWNSSISSITNEQGAGVLQTSRGDKGTTNFDTALAGSATKLWGTASTDNTVSKQSIYKYGFNGKGDSSATWNQTDFSNVKDGQGNTIDDYVKKVPSDSETLKEMPANGTVKITEAPAQSGYERKKYDYDKYDVFAKNETEKNAGKPTWAGNKYSETSFTTYKVGMDFNAGDERLAIFNGDGTSSMQIFEIKASALNSDTGLDFWFRNIPDNASVLINVVDDTTGAKTPITMRTGWRFWWGGSNATDPISAGATEISNGYVTGDKNSELYSKVAQKIMWNFADSSSVTIKGGKVSNATVTKLHADAAGWYYPVADSISNSSVDDDPSAAMLGSIMVPNGSLESHVTTNGRVYVGKDFCMYNPTQAKHNGGAINSASIIDMDQERHNFPWAASYNPQGVRIKWSKVDSDGEFLKAGTTWAVYGSLEAAKSTSSSVKPLTTVGDNVANDADSVAGVIEPMTDLKPNATYYVKETGTIEGYTQNTNIYRIVANEAGDTYSTIDKVYNSAGIEITDEDSKLLHSNNGIINKTSGTAVEWKKTDSEQGSAALAGSIWQLKAISGSDKNKTWTIEDNRVKVTSVTVNGGADISMKSGTTQTVAATVLPEGAPQSVTWSSTAPKVASVTAGTITALTKGTTTIKACSTSDASVCGNITVTVTDPEVSALSVANESGKTVASGDEISLVQGGSTTLTATVTPDSVTPVWRVKDSTVASLTADSATSTSDGDVLAKSVTINALQAGTTTITVSAGDKTITFRVQIQELKATVYFPKSWNAWSSHYLAYWDSTSSTQYFKEMSISNCNSDYYSVSVPLSQASSSWRFKVIGGSNWDNAGNNQIWPDAYKGSEIKFNGTQTDTLYDGIKGGETAGEALPSGCSVASQNGESGIAVASVEDESDQQLEPVTYSLAKSAVPMLASSNNTVDCSNDGYRCDVNSNPGEFKIEDVADGSYELKEQKAPEGYVTSNETYTFTVANGQVTWTNPSGVASGAIALIANTRKTGSVTWNKVSSEASGTKLSGSEWKLTQLSAWNAATSQYEKLPNSVEHDIVDCTESCGTDSFHDSASGVGEFNVTGLPWGEYQLIETKAPDGFNLTNTVTTFTIGPNSGSVNLSANGGNIANTPGVILPGTGGAGDYWIYAAALVAALIGVVAAGMALKVRRRQ